MAEATEENPAGVETKTQATEFFFPTHTDARRYQPGGRNGVYLDDVMREQAEIQRAKIEGREPDLDNPPAVVSTPLVMATQLNPDQRPPQNIKPNRVLDVTVDVPLPNAPDQRVPDVVPADEDEQDTPVSETAGNNQSSLFDEDDD